MKWLLLTLVLVSCYNEQKAKTGFSKAVAYDQSIASNYCARTFPCDTVNIGQTVYISDSNQYKERIKWISDQEFQSEHLIDSLLSLQPKTDTSCFNIIDVMQKTISDLRYQLKNIPPIRDTVKLPGVVKLDHAPLAACQDENTKLVTLLTTKNAELAGWEKKAKNRFWVILIMGAIIGVGTYIKIAGFLKPKMKAV